MKKFLITTSLILTAIITTVLAAPNFIDWNQYRNELTAQANSITGRKIQIRGDIKISILPSLVLAIKDIHVANSPGATDSDLISIKSLEVHLALAPLLTRSIQVKSLKLVDPVANIEFMDDSKSNIFFQPKTTKVDLTQTNSETSVSRQQEINVKPVVGGFTVQVDNFIVENGVLNYRNDENKKFENIRSLNGRFRLASLKGPMEASGTALVENIPINFMVSVGQIVKERTLPFNFTTTIIPGEVETNFIGTISNIKEDPKFKGKITTKGKNLGAFFSAITGNKIFPGRYAKPFKAAANITSDLKTLLFKNFEIKFIDTKGVGSIEVALGNEIDANILLSINKIDLDQIMELSSASPDISREKTATKSPNTLNSDSVATESPELNVFSNLGLKIFPKAMSANLTLSVQSVIYKNSTIRQAKLNASLVNREITLSQLSALLPGNTDIAVFGFISESSTESAFDGSIDLVTNDLQELLRWNGLTPPAVAPNRLNKLKMSAKLKGDKKSVKFSNLKLKLDDTKIRGSGGLVLTRRPSLVMALTLDSINLDSYISKNQSKQNFWHFDGKKRKFHPNIINQNALNSQNLSVRNRISNAKFLNSFDVHIKTTINSIMASGIKVSKIRLDAILKNGNLFINNSSFQNLMGIQGKVSGQLIKPNLGGGLPSLSLKNLRIKLLGKSILPFLKSVGIKPTVISRSSGPVRLNATINGRLDRLNVLTDLNLKKGTVHLRGLALPFEGDPSISGNIQFTHGDLTSFLRTLGIAYRPISKKMKKAELAANLKVSGKSISFKELAGSLAGIDVRGLVNIKFSDRRPTIKAKLAAGKINLNELISQNTISKLFREKYPKVEFKNNSAGSYLRKVSWSSFSPHQSKLKKNLYASKNEFEHWPGSPINLTYMNLFDADVELTTQHVIVNKLKFNQLKLNGGLQKGKLKIHQATGNIFGGKIGLGGILNAKTKSNQIETQFYLDGLNLPSALNTFQDRTLNSGTLDFSGNLSTNGRNVVELISRLNGVGSVAFKNLGISSSSQHVSAFASITSLLASLNQFAAKVGGKRAPRKAAVQGRFQIVDGIIKFNNTILTSGIGNGVAKGFINLPKWELNSTGSFNLSQNVLMQMLLKEGAPKSIPFQISGLLDRPNVKFDTSGLSKKGIIIPGKLGRKIDSILKNKGIGSVLKEMIPLPNNNSKTISPGSKHSSKPDAVRQQKKPQPTLKPEDILKGILRGLSQ